ncbi:hypothetical protein AJ80_04004 [Polytolypa hystricis UAMH7299]|uniref:N-acetyltransferase domain-containing protein n=1 Tax=Polytolypa hystricis (strain UAMH7299) TaxID=1447883 RepID=A0A2B7Y5C8_POLH7|nr:hypothetical protein AJ80_04004 [Polytolypa hystricis UAMH7299]
MGLTVLPATLSDIPSIYDTYFAAFAGEPILSILFPNQDVTSPSFRTAHSAHTAQYWQTLTVQHTLKCVDTVTGQIVGMATWDVYWREKTDEERKVPKAEWLEGKDRERAEEFLTGFWEAREKVLAGSKHVYCMVLATHPDHRRRGIGKLLMEWGTDIAERLNLPVYLEATYSGLPLYEKLGFQTLNEGVMLRKEITGWNEDVEAPLMAKMPGAAGEMGFEEWVKRGRPKMPLLSN